MNYKLLWRRTIRHKGFNLLNLLGLTLGIGTSILIFAFVYAELTHDEFHANSERIYRINQTFIWGDDNENQFSSTGPGVAVALKKEVPEFEDVVRVHTPGQYLISNPERADALSYDNDALFAVDENFLEVFSFPLQRGNSSTCLSKPNSLILSRSTARKYFGQEDPIGKTLVLERGGGSQSMMVTGVLHDIPDNSYIQFDMITPLSSIPRFKRQEWSWIWTTYETFGLLRPGANIDHVVEKLQKVPEVHAEPTLKRIMGVSFDEYIASGKEWNLYAQPFTGIHLGSEKVYNRLNSVGNPKVVNTLLGAALFVLLLSCLNYVNLKTSQVSGHARVSGLMQLLGASRLGIGLGYFLESLAFCLVAVVLGVLLLLELLSPLNSLFNENISLDFLAVPQNFMLIIVGVSFLTLLSGLYPAYVLSAYKPIDVLRGTFIGPGGSRLIRNGLLTFQFVITMVLLTSTILVIRQLEYTLGQDLGFSRENLISLEKLEWTQSREALLADLKSNPMVQNASLCSGIPPEIRGGDQFIKKDDQRLTVPLNFIKVDQHYFSTLELELQEGRAFRGASPAEREKVILNEAALKALEWNSPAEAIGKRLIYPPEKEFEIIGVVQDFSFWGANAPVEPMALFHLESGIYDGDLYFIALKTKPIDEGSQRDLVANIGATWQSHSPKIPMELSFVEDNIRGSFKEDRKFANALSFFSILAICIASLGLLAILIFSLEQRTKEIAIRKILGSSMSSVGKMMVKEFFLVIMIAIAIGIPMSYLVIDPWLSTFEDPIRIGVLDFITSGSLIILISALISLVYLFKAQKIDPILLLKED